MNYDEQHERVERELAEKKALEQSQQQKFQERLKKILLMYGIGETLQTIGDAVGVTRERVRQILATEGITGRCRQHNAQDERRERIANYILANPLATEVQIAEQIGCSSQTVHQDIKVCGIKRDIHAILSAGITKSKLRGRPELTQEFLQREYLDNNLSTNDIAKKYGYQQGAVSNRLVRYGMRKDKALVARQISEKRKATQLINGRFV